MFEPGGANREEEAGLARYPEYRSSGVDWLGEIPAHWEVQPLRSLARRGPRTFTDGDWIESPYITDDGVRLVQTGNVGIGHYKEQGFRYVSEDTFHEFGCTEIRPDDVLICRLAHPVGRACLAPDLGTRMITSVDVCILKPAHKVVPLFLVYSLSASDYLAFMGGICRGGTRDRVSRSTLGSVPIRVPPLSEQYAIAKFLDKETTRIDALVATQQELTRLLQEKRTALINHAVTKGLDPDVAMKDSGVEWLGEIPAHWTAQRLRTLVSITTGDRDTVDRRDDGEYPFFVRSPIVERIDTWSFDGEAVLTAGDGVGVAKVFHYANGRFDFHQRVYKFSDFDGILGQFFYRYFGALLRFETLRGTAKSTVDSLRLPMLQNFPFVVPPIDEQAVIVDFLDRETASIDAVVAKTNDAIAHLNEYRTALISAAVTGKIDVRAHVHTDDVPTGSLHPTP